MSRLTCKFDHGCAGSGYKVDEYYCEESYDGTYFYGEAINRLGLYENTGLEPEDIQEAVNLFNDGIGVDLPRELKSWVERCTWHVRKCHELNRELEKYKKAEAERAIIKPPCVVGDTLYHASCAFNRVDEYTVLSISMLLSPNVSRMEINAVNHRGAVLPFDVSDFGDAVFLTREEAEKALEEANGL